MKTNSKVDVGNASLFSQVNENTNLIKFDPKQRDVGLYIIKVSSMFISKNLNFSNTYRIFVNVSDVPRILPLPKMERIRFQIVRISKKGEV